MGCKVNWCVHTRHRAVPNTISQTVSTNSIVRRDMAFDEGVPLLSASCLLARCVFSQMSPHSSQHAMHSHSVALLWSPMQIFGAASSGESVSGGGLNGDGADHGSAARTLLPPRAGPSPLGDMSLHLLLLLNYSPEDPPLTCNPYRRAMAALEDADYVAGSLQSPASETAAGRSLTTRDSSTGGDSRTILAALERDGSSWTTSSSQHVISPGRVPEGERCPRPIVSFRQLHDAIATWGLDSDPEPTVLLLYCLIHGCPGFRDHTLSRTDMEVLMLPLLRLSHLCPPEATCHSHMLQVRRCGGYS